MEKSMDSFFKNSKIKSFFGKNLFFSLLLLVFVANATAQEQEPVLMKKISIEANDESLSSVLKRVEQLGDCKINFNYDDVDRYKVTIVSKNKTIKEVLDDLMLKVDGQPFAYRTKDSFITIVLKSDDRKQNPSILNVEGRVTDSQGEPLIGVNLKIKNQPYGGVTNMDGVFKIPIPSTLENPILVVTFVGMDTEEVVCEGEFLDIVLYDGNILSEVVVTGIFSKPRESYTGAVTSVTAKELKQAGNRSVLSSIRNIDPSFKIADNINIGSDPNQMPTITMRGNTSLPVGITDLKADSRSLREANQPLFILDGFEVRLERVMDLDENQVENITLLKDASSTALYGTRGSNGVVVITTRRPESGKLQVTYNGQISIEAPELSAYNLMNSREKLEYEKAAGIYSSVNHQQEQPLMDTYNRRKEEVERGVDTYWLKYPVRTGVGSRHGLNINGGDETFRYGAGISYNNIAGAMKGAGRNIFNGNILFIYKLKNLSFQNDLQIVSSKAKNSPYGNFSSWTKINSYYKPYDDDGTLSMIMGGDLTPYERVYNPLYNAMQPMKNESNYQQIVNNFSIEWYVLPELFFRGRFSVTSENNRSDNYISANHTMFADYSEENYNRKGRYTLGMGEMSRYEGDITLNYSKTFADVHQLYAGLGYNFGESKAENYQVVGEGMTVLNMDFLGMASKYEKDGRPYGTESITRRVGTLFNGNYTYDRRYFVDLSGSLEGSSQFGANKRYAPFWSTGIGWNLSNETFLKDSKIINEARFRFSYGMTGSQSFNPYQALLSYKDYGGKDYMGWYGSSIMAMGNKDLGWQKTGQYNIGTDWRMFNGRIRFNVDAYNRITDNLLTDINLPLSSGFISYRANVGKVQNTGLEIGANAFLIQEKTQRGFSWSVGGMLAHNKNQIKEISNSLEFLNEELSKQASANPSFMYKEGESMNTIYAVQSKGIDPSNGKEIFIKQDGSETYVWDSKDQIACGDQEPKVFGNLNTSLRYSGFTLTAYFGYHLGGYVYNSTLVNKIENIQPYENADKRAYYDRWRQPGDHALFKSLKEFDRTYASSRFVMKENLLTGQSISLMYEFPSKWTKKHLGCQYLSLRGYTEDFLYLSSVKREVGISYPYARKFSLTITARF